jgi:hypothetical protein
MSKRSKLFLLAALVTGQGALLSARASASETARLRALADAASANAFLTWCSDHCVDCKGTRNTLCCDGTDLGGVTHYCYYN